MKVSFSENKKILVHQALHGYADGHRLIETSRSLPREAEGTMLILSDMSGSTMVRGFESYLTGYPLPGTAAYALARTWYAPEMARPGCVWTHTLIIENADLARIKNLSVLVGLFVRPGKERPHSYYRSQLAVPNLPNASAGVKNSLESLATLILAALYGLPNRPVFIPSERSDEYENLVLAIWSQQWPGLRRSFWFCMGSLSNRRINGRLFDIQVIPQRTLDQMRREVPSGQFVEVDKATDSSSLPLWASTASTDLLARDNGLLKDFLWNFGAETSEGRKVFSRLVEMFVFIKEVGAGDLQLDELTEVVSRRFPAPHEATRLKAAIFGGVTSNKERFLPRVAESELLRELATTAHYAAFDAKTLAIRRRAKLIWMSEPAEAQHLALALVNANLNPLGEEFLAGISEVIEAEDVIRLSEEKPGLLYIFVNQNPTLAASPSLWRLSFNEQRELFDAVATAYPNIPTAISKRIVAAMLEAEANAMAEDSITIFGEDAVNAVLDWFDTSDESTPEGLAVAWRRALESRPTLLLKWLSAVAAPREASVAMVASLLDPHSPEVHQLGTDMWLRLAKSTFSKPDRETLIDTVAFILALGFDNPDPGACGLVVQAFQTVHDAAERDELGYGSWRLLKDQVPSLSWWQNWDKCERLRRALVEIFYRHDWPTQDFLRAVKRQDTFRRMVDFCCSKSWGRKFLEKVAEQVAQGGVHATDFQRAMLFNHRSGSPCDRR